jgi:transposase-like protein
MTRAERRTHWRAIIENQATSGVSIAAYCRDAQIKPSYFYTWRRRLREQQPCAGGLTHRMGRRARCKKIVDFLQEVQ